MAKVLIIGASRGIGFEAVKQALDHEHDVRAFARSAKSIPINHPNLEKRPGDALNEADIRSALKGIDAVIQVLGIAAGPKMIFGPVTLFSAATRILVREMEAGSVHRLIAVTGFGAGDSRERIRCFQVLPFQLFLGRAYDDKDVQERLVEGSGLDWTIVRPGILTNRAKTADYHILEDPESWKNGIISRADVADFLVKQIDDDRYVRKKPVLIC